MTSRFTGKTVLITGGASGLGAACAEGFAAEGAALVLVDLNGGQLEQTAIALRETGAAVETVVGDASSGEIADRAVELAMKRFGRLDVLFNNAGIDPLTATTVTGTTEQQWDAVMNVNVKSAYLFSKAAIPAMEKGGTIVNTASVSAVLPSPSETAYSVSKAAIMHLTKCIALDYADIGIRANCICPGFLESVMSDRKAELSKDRLAQRAASAEEVVPMRRQGSYDEIARSVLFLASADEASYITGAALVIDGGLTLK